MNIDELVMGRKDLWRYIIERKFDAKGAVQDSEIEGMNSAVLHNGFTREEIERLLTHAGLGYVEYRPEKSSESHFYVPETRTLHVVNSRGMIRLRRDLDQLELLGQLLVEEGKRPAPINVTVRHYDDKRASASRRFDELAEGLVQRLFDDELSQAVRSRKYLAVVLGPHESLPTGAKVMREDCNDYLNFKLLQVDKKLVVAFDYIFADQALRVLDQVARMSDGLVDGHGKALLDVYHYGKIGLLNRDLSVGQVCVPEASLNETDLADADRRQSPIRNHLAPNHDPAIALYFGQLVGEPIFGGTTINTTSVLAQTRANLEYARKAGGDFLDMEWAAMAGIDHGIITRYENVDRLQIHFAGIGSDMPLEGITLGNTSYPSAVETKVASAYLKIIAARK